MAVSESRSATPRNAASSPMGSSSGAIPAPKASCSSSRVRSNEARSRSSLLTKISRGSPSSAAAFHMFAVCTSTPSTALTTNTARSATARAARRFLGEVGVAGAVDHVDLVPVPLDGRQGRRDRQAPLVLLGLEVGDRGGVLDPPGPADGTREMQESLGQGGLPGPAVADQGDVADRRGG